MQRGGIWSWPSSFDIPWWVSTLCYRSVLIWDDEFVPRWAPKEMWRWNQQKHTKSGNDWYCTFLFVDCGHSPSDFCFAIHSEHVGACWSRRCTACTDKLTRPTKGLLKDVLLFYIWDVHFFLPRCSGTVNSVKIGCDFTASFRAPRFHWGNRMPGLDIIGSCSWTRRLRSPSW
jgi:hypothetical protein